MMKSTTYQPEDRWSAEPVEPKHPRTWRTRTVVLLVVLAALAGVGGTIAWVAWQQSRQQAMTIPQGTIAVAVDDPLGGAITSDQVLLAVIGPATDAKGCDELGGSIVVGVMGNTIADQPAPCAIAVTPVLGHRAGRLIVALPADRALRVQMLQATHHPLTVLPWQLGAPPSDGQRSMVEPQK